VGGVLNTIAHAVNLKRKEIRAMEDRYLFKAKRVDNGEWVQGYLFGIWEKRYILWGMTNDIPDMIEVDPSTICQCTGLKDKNSRLICENDIVKDTVIYGVAKWDDANARYVIDDREDGYQDYSEWWQEVEVIGNIFDNPELLESEG
jgi:hypothetical protein